MKGILIGAIIFLFSIILIYFLWKFKSKGKIKIKKYITKEGSKIVVEVGKEIKELVIEDKYKKEKIKFMRKDIKAGERIIFEYPTSKKAALVRITTDEGNYETTVEPELDYGDS